MKLIPKVAAKDSKNKGLSVGGDGSSATAPKNEVYPVVTLGLAPKRRFSRREISCPQAVGRPDTGLKRGLPGWLGGYVVAPGVGSPGF